jgi:hypothetical protein
MLRLWWWMFSPWYRRLGTPKRAEKYIAHVASEHDVTRPQAIALICQEMPEPLRPVLNQYREVKTS